MTQDLGTIIRYLRWGSVVFFALGALCLILTLVLLSRYQVIKELKYRRTKKRIEAARYRVAKRMREREIAQREDQEKKKRAEIEKAVKASRDEATEYLRKVEVPEGAELTTPLVTEPAVLSGTENQSDIDDDMFTDSSASAEDVSFTDTELSGKPVDNISPMDLVSPEEMAAFDTASDTVFDTDDEDDFDSMMDGAEFETGSDPYRGEESDDMPLSEEETGHVAIEPMLRDGRYMPDYIPDTVDYDDEETEPLYMAEGSEPTMPLIFVKDGDISDETEDLLDKETTKLDNAEEYIRQRHVEFTMMDNIEIKGN